MLRNLSLVFQSQKFEFKNLKQNDGFNCAIHIVKHVSVSNIVG